MPGYLTQLGDHLGAESQDLQAEAQAIVTHVEHIGRIVVAQQSYARRSGITEEIDVAELLDSAIALNFTDTTDITVNRDYQPTPAAHSRPPQTDSDTGQPAE